MTIEKLINWEWTTSISDLFTLKNHREEWIKKPGFGTASVDKVLNAIDAARDCPATKFICALGIPLIGKVASEALMKKFHNYNSFRAAIEEKSKSLYEIAGIGEVMIEEILNYDYTEADYIYNNYINEKIDTPIQNDVVLKDKIFCITGKTKNWKNRDELKSFIESKGGKVTGSVTIKTSYLINNDTTSQTSKNLTAIKLHVPIINEEEFLELITPPIEDIESSYIAPAT